MPIPLVVWPAVGLVSAGVAAVLKKLDDDSKRDARKKAEKKKRRRRSVALVGPRGSGKTSLRHLLVTGEVPAGYAPTAFPTTGSTKTTLDGIEVDVDVHDVSGMRSSRKQWSAAVGGADLVVFLSSAADLRTEQGYDAIQSAAHFYAGLEDKPTTLLVVSHADQVPEPGDPPYENLASSPAVRRLAGIVEARDCLVANLLAADDQEAAVRLVKDSFS